MFDRRDHAKDCSKVTMPQRMGISPDDCGCTCGGNERVFSDFPFKHGKFNGHGKTYWQRKADKLVVEVLVGAAMTDKSSIIAALAARRFMELAMAESSQLVQEVLCERERCQKNLAQHLRSILGEDRP